MREIREEQNRMIEEVMIESRLKALLEPEKKAWWKLW
jgi:hypothetical protein